MGPFTTKLIQELSEYHLLKHPYYQDWNEGKLTVENLKSYARQYFHHVDAFPRYISATHSLCADIQTRQLLLDNLVDEEKGSKNHPELWLQFVEGLGEERANAQNETLNPETNELIETFYQLSRSSAAEGIGSLFAYEYQVPEVAANKIEGLKKFYGIEAESTLEFFEVHKEADVYHSEATAKILDALPSAEQEKARAAAIRAAQALWRFLDGVQSARQHAA